MWIRSAPVSEMVENEKIFPFGKNCCGSPNTAFASYVTSVTEKTEVFFYTGKKQKEKVAQ